MRIPWTTRDRGQSRSTVGQNLHILYITGHLYDLDGYEKWRGFGLCRWRPLDSQIFLSLIFSMQIEFSHLTRARVAVSATFAMVGGGGPKWPPPLTRKLGKLEGRAIRRSTALSEPIRSHFGHFFAQVNIEVSRGHQRSNFRKMMVLSGMPAIISGTIIATPNPKKAKDSSWNALSLRWRQISPKINRLRVRGHERSKTAFLSETVFQW